MIRFIILINFIFHFFLLNLSQANELKRPPLKNATPIAAQEFTPEQLTFDFMSTEGSWWHDCTHEKGLDTHMWVVTCDRYRFRLHLVLKQYVFPEQSTYEFHFSADEDKTLHETHTQSTWITADNKAYPKKIISYLGFQKDSSQFRIEIQLKK